MFEQLTFNIDGSELDKSSTKSAFYLRPWKFETGRYSTVESFSSKVYPSNYRRSSCSDQSNVALRVFVWKNYVKCWIIQQFFQLIATFRSSTRILIASHSLRGRRGNLETIELIASPNPLYDLPLQEDPLLSKPCAESRISNDTFMTSWVLELRGQFLVTNAWVAMVDRRKSLLRHWISAGLADSVKHSDQLFNFLFGW